MVFVDYSRVDRESAENVHFYFYFTLFIFDGDFLAGGLAEVSVFCSA